MKLKLHKKHLDKKQQRKVTSDLNFLSRLLSFSKNKGFRVVVSGGYGLDGILEEITRPHNDLDMTLFAKGDRKKTVKAVKSFIVNYFPSATITTKPGYFYEAVEINAKGFGAAIYVVETINNPLKDIRTIKLTDGKTQVNSEKRFPPPVKAELHNLQFEAQNPNLHLADILYKRKKEKRLKKHKQDIQNLRQITDNKKVNLILSRF
jgi:hypothetical protein